MSVEGNIAVKVELEFLLKLLDDTKDRSAAERVEELRKSIESTIEAAKSGWL